MSSNNRYGKDELDILESHLLSIKGETALLEFCIEAIKENRRVFMEVNCVEALDILGECEECENDLVTQIKEAEQHYRSLKIQFVSEKEVCRSYLRKNILRDFVFTKQCGGDLK